jgi:DNA primase
MSARWAPVVEKHFDVVTRMGDEWLCRCPQPAHATGDSHPSLQINVRKGLFVCFSGACGWRGCLGEGSRSNGKDRATFPGLVLPPPSISDLRKRLDEIAAMSFVPDPIPTIGEHALARFQLDSEGAWAERGLDQKTVTLFELGYDFLEDALTFPLRTYDGRLLGVGRRYLNDPDRRYIYPNSLHFKKSLHLHGSWLVAKDERRHVVLVEGPVDTNKVWQAGYMALGQYGSSLSAAQVRLMHRLDIDEVTLMHDNDESGWKATEQAKSVLKGFRVNQVIWPSERRFRKADPGKLDVDTLDGLIANRDKMF